MTTSLQPTYALVPGANLEAYIHTVNSIPLLTPEQERELADSLYYEQDLGAARQMVLAHLRFVVHIARSYSGYGLSQADLIQEGLRQVQDFGNSVAYVYMRGRQGVAPLQWCGQEL